MIAGKDPTVVTAYGLVRFSSGPQALGSSEHRQIGNYKAECKRRGWKFDESLCVTDLGVSAFRGKNFQPKAALGKFLEAAKKGLLLPNPVLIIENPDRFSRAELDSADSTLWQLVKDGVSVLFLSNGLLLEKGDQNDPFKRSNLMFDFHRAHKESERKSEWTKGALKRKLEWAEQGRAVNFGNFRPTWVDFIGHARQPGEFKLNEVAKLIRRIVDMALAGRSQHEIARILIAGKVPTLRGGQWCGSLIASILRSALLVGTVTICGKTLDRYYPPVVSDAEWERLQVLRSQNVDRRGGSRPGFPVRQIFRNRTKCAECGGAVSSHASKLASGEIRSYFQCYNRQRGMCGVVRLLAMEAVEMDFFGNYVRNYPLQTLATQDHERDRKINALRERVRSLDQQLADAVELLGKMAIKALEEKIRKLNNERASAQAELDLELRHDYRMNSAPTAWEEVLNTFKATNGKTTAELNEASEELRRQLADPEIRRRLRDLIPSMISWIEIDLMKQRYAVVDLTGKRGPWRDVSAYATALNDPWAHRRDALGEAHRRKIALANAQGAREDK